MRNGITPEDDPLAIAKRCGKRRNCHTQRRNDNQMLHIHAIIDAAMKYYDKTQFGRDRTPGDPQRFYNVNSLVWRYGAAGVRALPVLTAHDISLPEQ